VRPRRVRKGADHGVTAVELPSVVVVPHLGASTFEAQDKAGITIAEQVQLALAGDFVPYAVNVAAGEVSTPFVLHGLAEVLGRFIGGLLDGKPADLEVTYLVSSPARDQDPHALCAQRSSHGDRPRRVSFVNAPQLAVDHNLTYSEISTVESPEYVNRSRSGPETTWCRHVGHHRHATRNAHCRR